MEFDLESWNEIKWCSLGNVFDNNVNTASVYQDSLIIAGRFRIIDNDSIPFIAKWVGGNYTDSCQVVGVNEIQNNKLSLLVYPSLTTGKFSVSLPVKYRNPMKLFISDLQGRKLKDYDLKYATENYEINIDEFDNGIYLVSLIFDGNVSTAKIIKYE